MRTTLVLDDRLFRRAKSEAASSGMSLSELVNFALRRHFLGSRTESKKRTKFAMPVFGQESLLHQNPDALAMLRDEGR